MKKNIYDKYFNSGKLKAVLQVCYLIFIVLFLIGVFIMYFGYGIGPTGGILCAFSLVGMAIAYFVQEGKLASDTSYDNYINKQLQSISKEDYNCDYSFTVYGESTTGRVKSGKDNSIRTDCYYQTEIILQEKSIIIYVYSVCNEIPSSEKYTVPVRHVSATLDTRYHKDNPKIKFEYMTIFNDKTPVCEFPVPPKNYDVEMLYNKLVS